MVIAELIRLEEGAHGTFSVLKLNKSIFCFAIEPPDNENITNISSIPAQQYICERVKSPRYGKTFQVMDVPERAHVLFHAGNIVDHTKGCIILGQTIGKLKGKRAVLNSGKTFDKFLFILSSENKFHLTIREVY